jgi:N-acetylmuramoyl-L-alanine amidase
MTPAIQLLALADRHLKEPCKVGAFAPPDNSNWKGPWDSAGFASWLVFQTTGSLLGCSANNLADAEPHAAAWARAARSKVLGISLEKAKGLAGAVLIRRPVRNGIGHVALSRGDGTTIEAHSESVGIVYEQVDGRRWDLAMRIPFVRYLETGPSTNLSPPKEPFVLLRDPPMRGALVERIQESLFARRFDPGQIDGVFGRQTEAAVRAFQLMSGLVPDGEVGAVTLTGLGLAAAHAAVPF